MSSTDLIERLYRQRNRLLQITALSFALWWAIVTVQDARLISAAPASRFLAVAAFVCALGWGAGLLAFGRWSRVLAKHRLEAVLNDELFLRNRIRARQIAFWATLVGVVLGRGVLLYTGVPPLVVLDVIFWIAIMSSIGAFLWFNRAD